MAIILGIGTAASQTGGEIKKRRNKAEDLYLKFMDDEDRELVDNSRGYKEGMTAVDVKKLFKLIDPAKKLFAGTTPYNEENKRFFQLAYSELAGFEEVTPDMVDGIAKVRSEAYKIAKARMDAEIQTNRISQATSKFILDKGADWLVGMQRDPLTAPSLNNYLDKGEQQLGGAMKGNIFTETKRSMTNFIREQQGLPPVEADKPVVPKPGEPREAVGGVKDPQAMFNEIANDPTLSPEQKAQKIKDTVPGAQNKSIKGLIQKLSPKKTQIAPTVPKRAKIKLTDARKSGTFEGVDATGVLDGIKDPERRAKIALYASRKIQLAKKV